jgi:hypothetical protein
VKIIRLNGEVSNWPTGVNVFMEKEFLVVDDNDPLGNGRREVTKIPMDNIDYWTEIACVPLQITGALNHE